MKTCVCNVPLKHEIKSGIVFCRRCGCYWSPADGSQEPDMRVPKPSAKPPPRHIRQIHPSRLKPDVYSPCPCGSGKKIKFCGCPASALIR